LLQDPGVSEKLAAMGATAVGNTPEQFGAAMRADSEKWAKLIREANIRASENGKRSSWRDYEIDVLIQGFPRQDGLPRGAWLEHDRARARPRTRGAGRRGQLQYAQGH